MGDFNEWMDYFYALDFTSIFPILGSNWEKNADNAYFSNKSLFPN